MSRPPVTVAFHAGEVGGPLRSLERELRWLAERSELEILVPRDGPIAPALQQLGGAVRRGPYLPLLVPGSARAALRLGSRTLAEIRWFRAALRARAPRLAIAVTAAVPSLLAAARLERVPSVLWLGELLVGAGRPRSRELAGRALLGIEARLAGHTVACSEAVARQLPGSAPVTTIHPGIGVEYASGDGPGFRRRHGIPRRAPCVACVGNLTRGRGQDVLLRALPELRGRHPGLRCVIEGEPFDRPADREFSAELDRLAAALGVSEAVVRSSGTDPVGDLYAAVDVLVNPATTHPESFGRVPLEAGVAGVPSVCTSLGAIPELHADGRTALLVDPGDPRSLAAAADRLLEDRELGARLARGAAELAGGLADPERSLAAFKALIGPLL
jgi:glycosyltransferase involved in cell wall biosynthesis